VRAGPWTGFAQNFAVTIAGGTAANGVEMAGPDGASEPAQEYAGAGSHPDLEFKDKFPL
jgi:hypothetical protein